MRALLVLGAFLLAVPAAADYAAAARAALSAEQVFLSDPAVDRAACDHATQVLREQGGAVAARSALWSRGVRDYTFRPFTVRGAELPAPERLPSLLGPGFLDGRHPRVLAICTAASTQSQALVVLVVERAVRWLGNGEPGVEILSPPSDYGPPRLYATTPGGTVETGFARRLGGERWSVLVPRGPGRWLYEVVADGPTGPEVLALWPSEPSIARDRVEVAGNPAPTPEAAQAAETRLWALITAFRSAWGLPPLRIDPALTRAARTHARDLARGEAFGHKTSSGDALARIAREGVTAARAVENASLAETMEEAHAALLASPAHRMNLLDREVEVGGVGVVFRREEGRTSVAVSEVFARLAPADGAAAEAQIEAKLGQNRESLGLWRLKRRDVLDGIARSGADQVLSAGRLALPDEQRRALIDQVAFHFRNAKDVSVHLLATADPLAVGALGQLRDPDWTEYGLALVRTTEPLDGGAPGQWVVAFLLVSR